jgi:hypothetical protein
MRSLEVREFSKRSKSLRKFFRMHATVLPSAVIDHSGFSFPASGVALRQDDHTFV